MNEKYQGQLQSREGTLAAAKEASQLPHIVTVGRYRVGRLLQTEAQQWSGQARFSHIAASFDEAVTQIEGLHRLQPIDALVGAGASGTWIRERVDFPFAMVEVRGLDLLDALRQAKLLTRADAPHVGLVSFGQPSAAVPQIDALFGLGLVQVAYQGPQDAAACVQKLEDAAVGAVVAPGLVADLAEQSGMASVLLYSEAAVRQAISDALLLARHRQAERDRHQRLETVLHQLQDGVVALDEDGRICALNPHMAILLGAPLDALHGRRLNEVAPELCQARMVDGEEQEEVVQLAMRTVVVRRVPLVESGRTTGALLVCRDPVVIHRADRSLRASQRQRGTGARWQIGDYLGSSAGAQRVRQLASQFAASDATVLILGESGTGKELVAQGIHRASRRATQPFLAVNCAALSESLLESELFGYDEGAFTGAKRGGKTGLIEAAHTGTLFLDEVGDMPLALQSRLLRVLQEREILRVGSTTPIPVDVRVIAATHADLVKQVERGQFRRDLYYRLAVLNLRTPALHERGATDVNELACSMLTQRLRQLPVLGSQQSSHVKLERLLRTVLQHAAAHQWPGNVRELDNWVERLLACHEYLTDDRQVLDESRLLEIFPECASQPSLTKTENTHKSTLRDKTKAAQREHLAQVLDSVQGDQGRACEILGISRATLWRRMKA